MLHEFITMVLSHYIVLYSIVSIIAITSIGVLLSSLNIGFKSIDIINKISESLILCEAFRLIVMSGFVISLTLLANLVSSIIIGYQTSTYFSLITTLLTVVMYYLMMSSTYYHLRSFTDSKNTKEDLEVTL